METKLENEFNNIHFIGLGGVGMSGIALVAASRGYTVSGSDLKESKILHKLDKAGVKVFIGHDAGHIAETEPDIVVVSSAIRETNPELVAARERGIEVWPRARMLAYLGEGRRTLAVAGTHGKTTASSMLATALDHLDAKPTFVIGGVVDGYDTNALPGEGDTYVVEADESDGSFVYLDPYIAVVTNIEEDHLDHYADLDEIKEAFLEFMSSVPEDGAVIVCGEDPSLPELAHRSGRTVLSYGFSEDCDVTCRMEKGERGENRFSVEFPGGKVASVSLPASPGRHNILNATAIMCVLRQLGYGLAESSQAVSSFTGVRRRFDRVASVDGVDIVDDYGHHPTEIAATIEAAKTLGYEHVHVLFQPHRYSRTEALAGEFAVAFDGADSVTFMDVYSAGETPIPGVTGKTLVKSVLEHNPRAQVGWMPHAAEIAPYFMGKLHSGDLLITLGAGDVTDIGPLVAAALEERLEARR